MGTREWAPNNPEYLYHIYDDPVVMAAFTKGRKLDIVGFAGPQSTDPKWIFSLKKDMEALRTAGAAKGIVDTSQPLSLGTVPPDNNDIMVLKVGKGRDHPVLFAGCHHSREWISVEIPYLVAEYLICTYKDNPTKPQEKRIKHLLENRQIWFVPLVNPNGHRHTFKLDRGWRPNTNSYKGGDPGLPSTVPPNPPLPAPQYDGSPDRAIRYPNNTAFKGVDVNRNYPVPSGHAGTWGKETSGTSRDPQDCGPNSTWCGPTAGSEPETKLIMGLMNNKFKATITYHNYWEVIFYSDDAKGDPFVVDFVGKGMQTLIAGAPGGHQYELQNNSSNWDPTNYLTTGELVDYADSISPKRPAYTPELRPTMSSPLGFSRLPESEIEPCFLENLPAALALINCAGFDSAPKDPSVTVNSAVPPTKVQVVRHAWKVFEHWEPAPSRW